MPSLMAVAMAVNAASSTESLTPIWVLIAAGLV
jgi:hypothetical protein